MPCRMASWDRNTRAWVSGMLQEGEGGGEGRVPVVVRSGGIIAHVHLSKEAAELGFIKAQDLQDPRLFGQVEKEQGQRVALCSLSKGEDVKVPAGLCNLQPNTSCVKRQRKQESKKARKKERKKERKEERKKGRKKERKTE